MDGFRQLAAPLIRRTLIPVVVVGAAIAATGAFTIAIALVSGALIGFIYLWHIALGFDRLATGSKMRLPFVVFESVLRVLIAGAAPVLIVGRGPALGYLAYLVGFVAPLGVAAIIIRNLMYARDCATSR